MAVLEFVSAIEKQFGITFEPEMLNNSLVRNLKQLTVFTWTIGQRGAVPFRKGRNDFGIPAR